MQAEGSPVKISPRLLTFCPHPFHNQPLPPPNPLPPHTPPTNQPLPPTHQPTNPLHPTPRLSGADLGGRIRGLPARLGGVRAEASGGHGPEPAPHPGGSRGGSPRSAPICADPRRAIRARGFWGGFGGKSSSGGRGREIRGLVAKTGGGEGLVGKTEGRGRAELVEKRGGGGRAERGLVGWWNNGGFSGA